MPGSAAVFPCLPPPACGTLPAKRDPMAEDARQFVARLREASQRNADAAPLERLAGAPPGAPYRLDLWSLTPAELDQEMATRLSSLNEDIDCRPRGPITSHRRGGRLIVWAKRLLRWLTVPYTNLLLGRQRRFNEDLVAFHLATFIRLRRMEERLRHLDGRLEALEDAAGTAAIEPGLPPPPGP